MGNESDTRLVRDEAKLRMVMRTHDLNGVIYLLHCSDFTAAKSQNPYESQIMQDE